MRVLSGSALIALVGFVVSSSASAVTMAWTPIGRPGNTCEIQSTYGGQLCFGGVSYAYSIGTYEVTNAEYTEFLNAKAASDPYGLYNRAMGGSPFQPNSAAITRTGAAGSFAYVTNPGRENRPVTFISIFDAMRFANWMNNGQGSGDTETGAYSLLGGTATPTNGETVGRNPGASITLSSENEWYKAAYFDPFYAYYYDYPGGLDTAITCSAPAASFNTANCNGAVAASTVVGSYPGTPSPYGTYDQGGNVSEWVESIISGVTFTPPSPTGWYRAYRGGSAGSFASGLSSSGSRGVDDPTFESEFRGIRLVLLVPVPEPSTGLLVVAGLLGFGWRKTRA